MTVPANRLVALLLLTSATTRRTEKGCLLFISSSLDDEFIPE